MKLIKGLGLLSFLAVISGSCFDPPEFPVSPQIEYENLRFVPARQPGDLDSLILSIRFRDGDGNLGFYGEEDIDDPFHDVFFYQDTGTPGAPKIEPLSTVFGTPYPGEREYHLLQIADPSKGYVVTHRTRLQPGYSSILPAPETCPGSNSAMKNYEYLGGAPEPEKPADGRWLLIRAEDRAALHPETMIVDSIPENNPEYYQIRDSLYYTPNPDHYNIEVEFYVKDPNAEGGFRLFDWRDELCTTFDGRFPVFTEDESSVDGTLTYAMTSLGFKALFSIQTLKLRFRIKDRTPNYSNWEETPEFRL